MGLCLGFHQGSWAGGQLGAQKRVQKDEASDWKGLPVHRDERLAGLPG